MPTATAILPEPSIAAPVISPKIEFKNILVATDFSDESLAGLPAGIVMAKRFHSKMWIAHVLPPEAYTVVPSAGWEAVNQRLFEEAEHNIQKVANLIPTNSIATETVVSQGNVVHELKKLIKSCDIDLVVTGTHGRRGLKRFFLGSVAEEIFRNADCPVLIAGPNVIRREFRARRLVCPIDLRSASQIVVEYALALREKFDAVVTFVHAIRFEEALGLEIRKLEARIKEQMMRLIPQEQRIYCELVVDFGDPFQVIRKKAQERAADLVIMGAHPSAPFSDHLAGNAAYKVIAHAEWPVLTVPVNGERR